MKDQNLQELRLRPGWQRPTLKLPPKEELVLTYDYGAVSLADYLGDGCWRYYPPGRTMYETFAAPQYWVEIDKP